MNLRTALVAAGAALAETAVSHWDAAGTFKRLSERASAGDARQLLREEAASSLWAYRRANRAALVVHHTLMATRGVRP